MKSGWLLFTKRSISTQTNYRHILLETYRRQESGRLSIKDVYDDVIVRMRNIITYHNNDIEMEAGSECACDSGVRAHSGLGTTLCVG